MDSGLSAGGFYSMRVRGIRLAGLCVLAGALSLSACKPTYQTKLESPALTTAPESKEIRLDFDQIHSDVVDTLNDDGYDFVKDLDLSGDNEKKEFLIRIEIMENVSEEALVLFLSELMKAVGNAARTQDFRYSEPDDESFGGVFEKYGVHIVIRQSGSADREIEVKAGESFPFSPSN